MELLYMDDSGKVLLAKEAEVFEEVIAIRNLKIPFDTIIRYVYHTYKPGHPLSSYSWSERAVKVCRTYFSEETPEAFENSKEVKLFIKMYVEATLSPSERFYEKLKTDMDELKEYISNIPFSYKRSVPARKTVEVLVNNKKVEGTLVEDVQVLVDNSEEKLKAIGRAEQLIKMETNIKKLIKEEYKSEKEKEKSITRLFDTRG